MNQMDGRWRNSLSEAARAMIEKHAKELADEAASRQTRTLIGDERLDEVIEASRAHAEAIAAIEKRLNFSVGISDATLAARVKSIESSMVWLLQKIDEHAANLNDALNLAESPNKRCDDLERKSHSLNERVIHAEQIARDADVQGTKCLGLANRFEDLEARVDILTLKASTKMEVTTRPSASSAERDGLCSECRRAPAEIHWRRHDPEQARMVCDGCAGALVREAQAQREKRSTDWFRVAGVAVSSALAGGAAWGAGWLVVKYVLVFLG